MATTAATSSPFRLSRVETQSVARSTTSCRAKARSLRANSRLLSTRRARAYAQWLARTSPKSSARTTHTTGRGAQIATLDRFASRLSARAAPSLRLLLPTMSWGRTLWAAARVASQRVRGRHRARRRNNAVFQTTPGLCFTSQKSWSNGCTTRI